MANFEYKWEPIETAPRDGTMLVLEVDYRGQANGNPLEDKETAVTIGMNTFDLDGNDEWMMAGWSWEQDCFCAGSGKPLRWAIFYAPAE